MTSNLPPLAQASAAAAGAVLSNALVYPLDTMTTRLQTAVRKGDKAPKGYDSLLSGFETLLREEGWTCLYSGLASDTLSTALSNFIYHFCHAFLRERFTARKLRQSPTGKTNNSKGVPLFSAFEEILLGCLAGVVAKAIVSPLSNITVRQQTPTAVKEGGEKKVEARADGLSVSDDEDEDRTYGTAPSSLDVARDILQEKGWTGLWSGFKSSIILTTNPAITLYLFDLIKRFVIPVKHQEHPSPMQTFLAGAFASSVASAITYPLILSKTRLQFKNPSGRRLYQSNRDVFFKTIKKQGIAGMYQGLEGQIAKGFLSEGVKLTIKDRLELVIVLAHRILSRQQQRAAL